LCYYFNVVHLLVDGQEKNLCESIVHEKIHSIQATGF